VKIIRLSLASALAGAAAFAICSAPIASAAGPVVGPSSGDDGTVTMPPGGPETIYPRDQRIGGADPYTPFGSSPYVPFGTWTP
jgi:hypothetical protein